MNLMMPGNTTRQWHDMNLTAPRDRPPLDRAIILRILSYFRPYSGYALLTLGAIGLNSLLGLIPPLLVRDVFDRSLPAGDVRLLAMLVGGMILASLGSGLAFVGQNYLSTLVGQRVMFDLRNQMYARLLSMSLRFFTDTKTGEIMSRVTNDVNGVQQVVTVTMVMTATNALTVASTLFMMFTINWRLALVSVAVLPLFILPTRRVGKLRQRIAGEAQAKLAELNNLMHETLSIGGALLVKAFTRQRDEQARFVARNRELMRLQIRQSLVGRWFFMWLSLFGTVGPALIYGYGAWLAIRGDLTPGSIVSFVALLGRLYSPASMLLNVQVELFTSLALFRRIFEYLDLPVEIRDRPGASELPELRGRIAFEDVFFTYRPDAAPALAGVSFAIEPGQLAALVGPSGAGKTTITYLLPRLYDVTAGRITIDGHDIRDVTLESLARQIGMVTQETFLFHGTVRENLLYAKPDATGEELAAACRAAHIDDVIAALPEGYDTVVGERGYRLSGGEKQRLAIARVILKNPRILILDEATSALDSESERLVQEALERLMVGRTSLVIAHRLSTILKADVILVLDGGRVVERGTHAELLARGGLYARLYAQQFGAAAPAERPAASEDESGGSTAAPSPSVA